MKKKHVFLGTMRWLRLILLPLATIYGFVVWVRNVLFDRGILPSEDFSVPVITIGNLNTGGTGKTPHTEYLVKMLKDQYTVAVLSRGYKRNTRGYLLADHASTTASLGDEAMQVHQKFPDIYVAVHEKRRAGIKELLKTNPGIQVIILDDGFQHRYVNAGLTLLLTGYYQPFFDDRLLPAGKLREGRSGAKRADTIIVTKTPGTLSMETRDHFRKRIHAYSKKNIFFSFLAYGDMCPLTAKTPSTAPKSIQTVFLLTGIAHTRPLEEYLEKKYAELVHLKYPDHHAFTEKNLRKLAARFSESPSQSKIIVTTEKDAMRLKEGSLLECLSDIPVYYLPVEVVFHPEDKKALDDMIGRFLLD